MMENEIETNGSVVRGKELERYFALNDALREFTLLFQEENNERAAAIVGAAFLDTLLENTLVNFFVDDEKEIANLLKTDRPAGT
jgi:hypothetical protein